MVEDAKQATLSVWQGRRNPAPGDGMQKSGNRRFCATGGARAKLVATTEYVRETKLSGSRGALEHEGRQRSKARQNLCSGIKNRAADQVALDFPVKHGLAGGAPADDTGHPAVRLQLAA